MTTSDLNDNRSAVPIKVNSHQDQVKVWDAPTRIFHWMIVVLVATSWYTADNGFMKLHLWSGSILLTLVIFRIAWGLAGSTTARFSDFVRGPAAVVGYLRVLTSGNKPWYAGHNPAGGWMVVVLMGALVIQSSTGLFANDGANFKGPLAAWVSAETSDRVTDLHGAIFNFLLLLVWMHVVAVFFYLCVKRENLIVPMVTGKKNRALAPVGLRLKFAPVSIALLLFALAAGVVWLIVRQ